jgi:hypothetical protein
MGGRASAGSTHKEQKSFTAGFHEREKCCGVNIASQGKIELTEKKKGFTTVDACPRYFQVYLMVWISFR